jgi:hypothetical protein
MDRLNRELARLIACVRSAAKSDPDLIHVARRQSQGLHIQLEYFDGWYTLTLSRKSGAPGCLEIIACRGAFNIPDAASQLSGKCYGQDGAEIRFARLRWHAYRQSNLLNLLTEENNA